MSAGNSAAKRQLPFGYDDAVADGAEEVVDARLDKVVAVKNVKRVVA